MKQHTRNCRRTCPTRGLGKAAVLVRRVFPGCLADKSPPQASTGIEHHNQDNQADKGSQECSAGAPARRRNDHPKEKHRQDTSDRCDAAEMPEDIIDRITQRGEIGNAEENNNCNRYADDAAENGDRQSAEVFSTQQGGYANEQRQQYIKEIKIETSEHGLAVLVNSLL